MNPAYRSQIDRARALLNKDQKVSEKLRYAARRITRLSYPIASDLDAEMAPFHVFRWVAMGSGIAAQRARADFVLHLRRARQHAGIKQREHSVVRGRFPDGWPREDAVARAFAVWVEAIEETRRRGGIAPRPDAIPWERYLEALTRAPPPRAAKRVSAAPHAADAPPPNYSEDASTAVDATQLGPGSHLALARATAASLSAAVARNDLATAAQQTAILQALLFTV